LQQLLDVCASSVQVTMMKMVVMAVMILRRLLGIDLDPI
jgi:hypothetical protein